MTGCFSLICSFRPDKRKGMTWIIQYKILVVVVGVFFFACSYMHFFYFIFFHQVHNVKNRCYLTDVWHFSKWTWWVHVKLLYDWNFNLIYKRSIFFSLKIYIFLWFDTIGCSEIYFYFQLLNLYTIYRLVCGVEI